MPDNQRKSILCPHCSKLISADEPRCPHCGMSRPGARWKNIPITRGLLQSDQLIKTIIYTNVGMYLISLLMNPTRMGLSANPFMFLSPSNGALLLLGSTGTIPIDQGHRWWTLVSANYLHGGILHIVFNMIALYQIGPLVLREYGANRLIGFYTLGGVFGFAGGKAAQALKPTAEAAKSQAARSAYRTTGGLKSDINKLYNMTPEDVGNELLDRGLIKLGTKRGSTKLADDIGEELSKFRSGQDKLISGLDEVKPKSFDVGKIVQKLEAQADEFANMGGAGNRSYANALRKEAEILTETGKKNISLAEALKLKRAFDQGGKFQSPLSEASAVEAARAARSTIKKEIDDTVSSIAGPQVTKAYEQTRQGASRLMSAKDALGQAEKRDIANKTFGLTDLLAGGGGAVIGAASGGGGAVGLAAGVAANKLISNYGASTTAVMLKKASDILAKEGLAAGTRKLSAMYGADMAGTITEALQEQKVNNKSEAVRDYLKGTRGQ